MRKRRQIELFSLSFLDILSGALGAVIILYVAIPKSKTGEVAKQDVVVETLKKDLLDAETELSRTKIQLSMANEKLAKLETKISEAETQGKDLDIGFKFKGKNLLFIIDTSFSMVEEDRIAQVKAGLKMLITSLSPDYKFEVIQFPLGERAPFKSLWGDIRENTGTNKMDMFEFIYNLRPSGGTPTRDVLLFALKNYHSISDIVLLSDGAPTFHNSNKKDDIFDILKVVREENYQKVQINCIGVGRDFIKDKMNDRYKFLSLLANENRGFFVGF